MSMHSALIYRELEKRIVSVEVVWHGQLHTIYFPKNRECDLIHPRRKEAILVESMRSGNAGGAARRRRSSYAAATRLQRTSLSFPPMHGYWSGF